MVGQHHRLNIYEFEQIPVDGEGQGSLAGCSPWGCKESDMTERWNWTEVKKNYKFPVHLMKACSFYISQLHSKPPFTKTEMSSVSLIWHTMTVVLWLWKVQDSCALGCLRKLSPREYYRPQLIKNILPGLKVMNWKVLNEIRNTKLLVSIKVNGTGGEEGAVRKPLLDS